MIDMEEFCQLENWYRTTYPDLYLEYDFLDDDGCPDGETATAKYKKLQEMIKEMRASYHKPGQSVDNFAIEAEIYEKLPSFKRPGVEITIKDLKLGKVMHYISIQAAERALGFKAHALHNYLKRRQEKPYLGRYEVERG